MSKSILSALRAAVTRSCNNLDKYVESVNIDMGLLIGYVNMLKESYAPLECKTSEYLNSLVDIDEESLSAEYDRAFDYKERYHLSLARAENVLSKLKARDSKQSEDDDDESVASSRSSRHGNSRSSRLPKLILPKFNGNVLQFRSFIERLSLIHI